MKKVLLVVLAMLLTLFIFSCNDDPNSKIDTVKTKDPAKTTTIVNDNLANDEFSPRY